jgi:hypothetical protein
VMPLPGISLKGLDKLGWCIIAWNVEPKPHGKQQLGHPHKG